MILQYVHQQVAGGVHHRVDASLCQLVELGFQLLHRALGDVGACTVQLGLLPGLDLDVDARHALRERDEVGGDALRGQAPLEPCPRLTGHKAQRRAPASQLGQHAGHIDALAAQHAVLAPGAVDVAHLQLTVQPHNVINGRVECHCVDHCSVSFTSVSCLYFGSGQRFVRIAPL